MSPIPSIIAAIIVGAIWGLAFFIALTTYATGVIQ